MIRWDFPDDTCLEKGLFVKLWGTRGSCPAPFSDRMAYGGNTSCVSVQWKEGIGIFDGGTGILALGHWLEEACQREEWDFQQPLHLFISHFHLDHIEGIPMFSWLFKEGAEIHLYGPGKEKGMFQKQLMAVLGPPYWPVSVGQVPASITWHDVEDGAAWTLPGDTKVRAMASYHPNGCLIYRLDRKGQSVVYGLDCELEGPEEAEKRGEEREEEKRWAAYREFALNCSLLLFDAPYTRSEYPAYRGFGHSFWELGLLMAKACRASSLCICHHNWNKTDQELLQTEEALLRAATDVGCQAAMAREGQSFRLQ